MNYGKYRIFFLFRNFKYNAYYKYFANKFPILEALLYMLYIRSYGLRNAIWKILKFSPYVYENKLHDSH